MEAEILRLMKEIEKTENEMLEVLLPECRRIFGKKAVTAEEREALGKEIGAFMELRKKLPLRVQSLSGYEIAKTGGSMGMSGFHSGGDSESHLPFQMIGWSDFSNYWGGGGIAFRIEKACFGETSPLLFFELTDDRFWCPDDNEEKLIEAIYDNSSSITDLRVLGSNSWGAPTRLEFHLSDTPQNRLLEFQGGMERAGRFGGYVIQIPICGEFCCVFGEVIDSEDIVLHCDSFCMK